MSGVKVCIIISASTPDSHCYAPLVSRPVSLKENETRKLSEKRRRGHSWMSLSISAVSEFSDIPVSRGFLGSEDIPFHDHLELSQHSENPYGSCSILWLVCLCPCLAQPLRQPFFLSSLFAHDSGGRCEKFTPKVFYLQE